LFDTRIRYTGLVFSREVSGAVIGGFTPLFATSLVLWSGGRSLPVSIYMIVTALTALLCAYLVGDIAEADQRGTTTATDRDALAGSGRGYDPDDDGRDGHCSKLSTNKTHSR
jgi:hypothetical protein